MLVQVNTEFAGSITTDAKIRFFNFMSCLYAVATAAAGSTPVVNPYDSAISGKNTNYNCITVLSNTEAGGWTAGASNNITTSTTYNASAASYFVDLYQSTGKSSAPYLRAIFGNLSYPFSNASFTTYPNMEYLVGHTTANPASAAYTGDADFSNASTSTGRWGTRYTGYNSITSAIDAVPYDVSKTGQTYYIACTANYIIITSGLGAIYFGLRSVSPWELSRTDNPPWVTWSNYIGVNYSNHLYSTTGTHFTSYEAWGAPINQSTGVQVAARKMGRGSQLYYNTSPSDYLTGLTVSTTGNQTSQGSLANGLAPATYPFASAFNISFNTAPLNFDGAVIDPVTGLEVPPAYPMTVRGYYTAGSIHYTLMGIMPGILRGPTNITTNIDAMLTSSEYTIGDSSYIPVRVCVGNNIGPDVFFLRKA